MVVKGGVVLELRLDRARATKDVDLRLTGDPKLALADLQAAGRLDLRDWMSFEIVADKDHPVIRGNGMVYDGYRFRAEARLAGNTYASPFGVDVGFADALTQEPEVIPGSDSCHRLAGRDRCDVRFPGNGRGTWAVPSLPAAWAEVYARTARFDGLERATLVEQGEVVRTFSPRSS